MIDLTPIVSRQESMLENGSPRQWPPSWCGSSSRIMPSTRITLTRSTGRERTEICFPFYLHFATFSSALVQSNVLLQFLNYPRSDPNPHPGTSFPQQTQTVTPTAGNTTGFGGKPGQRELALKPFVVLYGFLYHCSRHQVRQRGHS